MKRNFLGGTGMSVSDIALGTMMLGASGNTDHDECVRMIHTALEAGVNFVDTADIYSRGESEEIVGKALKGRRADVVLATKFGLSMFGRPDDNYCGGSPRWIARAVEDSLRRLDTDYIDLYQMHRPDQHTDLDETLAALSSLVRDGKVRAVGCSTFPPEMIVDAHWIAETRGHHHFRTEQPRYSIFSRTIEADVLPLAQRFGMGVLTYGPLSGGWMSGREDPTKGHRPSGPGARAFDISVQGNQAKLKAVEPLSSLAAEARMPITHLATAFVRAHPAVTSVIIGPRTPEQLDDLLAGSDVVLTDEVLDRIDEIVAPGTALNPADHYVPTPLAIEDKRLRRR
jgi:aryl-alcohol dehydrogenase-like predicted oxidoreductase